MRYESILFALILLHLKSVHEHILGIVMKATRGRNCFWRHSSGFTQ